MNTNEHKAYEQGVEHGIRDILRGLALLAVIIVPALIGIFGK